MAGSDSGTQAERQRGGCIVNTHCHGRERCNSYVRYKQQSFTATDFTINTHFQKPTQENKNETLKTRK